MIEANEFKSGLTWTTSNIRLHSEGLSLPNILHCSSCRWSLLAAPRVHVSYLQTIFILPTSPGSLFHSGMLWDQGSSNCPWNVVLLTFQHHSEVMEQKVKLTWSLIYLWPWWRHKRGMRSCEGGELVSTVRRWFFCHDSAGLSIRFLHYFLNCTSISWSQDHTTLHFTFICRSRTSFLESEPLGKFQTLWCDCWLTEWAGNKNTWVSSNSQQACNSARWPQGGVVTSR